MNMVSFVLRPIVCSSSHWLENKETRKITPELKRMINLCSNPLMRNTKECVVLWDTIDRFNKSVLSSKYEIDRSYRNIQQLDVDEHAERYFE